MLGFEFWLCKVLLHQGPAGARVKLDDLNDRAHRAVLAKIVSGDVGVLPDGCIVEPFKSFASELDAAAAREQMLLERPGEDWRVVVSLAVGG